MYDNCIAKQYYNIWFVLYNMRQRVYLYVTHWCCIAFTLICHYISNNSLTNHKQRNPPIAASGYRQSRSGKPCSETRAFHIRVRCIMIPESNGVRPAIIASMWMQQCTRARRMSDRCACDLNTRTYVLQRRRCFKKRKPAQHG